MKLIDHVCDSVIIRHGAITAKRKIKEFDKITDFECTKENIQTGYIASMTTIPYRIELSYYSVASILMQRRRPEKVLIVLDEARKEQYIFSDKFNRLFKAGVEILYRKDLRCHTKYYYAITEYPDHSVITFDDDCIYDDMLFTKLINGHKKYPDAVIAMRCRAVKRKKDGTYDEYNNWPKCSGRYSTQPRSDIIATGVGGVLYPPHIFDEETFNMNRIMEFSLGQDDIWLYFMERRNNILVYRPKGKSQMYVDVPDTQAISLQSDNVRHNRNDESIDKLADYYKLK